MNRWMWLVGLLVHGLVGTAVAQQADDFPCLIRHPARIDLVERGFDWQLIYTAEAFSKLSGGLTNRAAVRFRGDLSLHVDVATDELLGWPDGQWHAHLQYAHGAGLTNNVVGDFQTLSNIDAHNFIDLSELWYLHTFGDSGWWLKAGKQEANTDFAAVDYGCGFLNSSAGYAPTVAMVTYPDQNWGLAFGYEPGALGVRAGIFDLKPGGGPLVLVEPSLAYTLNGRPGKLRLGGWFDGNDYGTTIAGSTQVYREGMGAYVTWDQTITGEGTGAPGLGVFGQLGWTPGHRSLPESYVGLGCEWTGPFASRPSDSTGLGIFHVNFDPAAGLPEPSETAIETFYQAAVTPWLTGQIDLQVIVNPGGAGVADAVVLGTRWTSVF